MMSTIKFGILLIVLMTISCNYTLSVVLNGGSNPKGSESFLAGTGEVDITPSPGFAMGGFGSSGKIAHGWWTRLKAKSLYFEDSRGNRLSMVICDLWSMPAGLADRVIEILQTNKDSRYHIGRHQLMLAATHTHHSPGNFSTSIAYNSLASPKTAWEQELFEFLAINIAETIRISIHTAEQATIYTYAGDMTGLVRNRSYVAFDNNHAGEKQKILNRVGSVEPPLLEVCNFQTPS